MESDCVQVANGHQGKIVRTTKPAQSNGSRPKVVDLFAGVGGMSLGAARAGFDLALAVEWDEHASKAHKLNFPNTRHSSADIAKMTGEQLLEAAGLVAGELTGLVGGPPCQGFSMIGHRRAGDPRNNLFGKFFELVAITRPQFFVAENVLGILDDIYDPIRKAAFAQVSDSYTLLEPMRIKASDYGAPTTRERAFFIGFRKDSGLALSTKAFAAARVASTPTVATALAGLPDRIRCDWISEEQGWREVTTTLAGYFGLRVEGLIPDGVGDEEAIGLHRDFRLVSGCLGTRHTPAVRARFSRLKPGKQDKVSKAVRLKADGYCPTLRAGTGADRGSYQAIRPVHPTSSRVITPREAARLQGFPDWFQFAPSKWHSFRQIGNSVSPLVGEAVLKVIISNLHQTRSVSSRP